MDFETIKSSLELKFSPKDGIYRFMLFEHDWHGYFEQRPIYLAIPEFAEAESYHGKKRVVTLGVDKIVNTNNGFSRFCLSSQSILEDQQRPDLLLFHYMHGELLLCKGGELFSASPREVYEDHNHWAFPNRH